MKLNYTIFSRGTMNNNLFDKGRVFIFGYGSLMFPDGINGRGMTYNYDYDDLVPSILKEYERGMYALWGDRLFYGIVENEKSYMNGTIFEVHNLKDLVFLNISEETSPTGINNQPGGYILTDISEKVVLEGKSFNELYPDARCYSYVVYERNITGERNGNCDWYEDYVDHGMNWLGEEFIDEFLKTSTNKVLN